MKAWIYGSGDWSLPWIPGTIQIIPDDWELVHLYKGKKISAQCVSDEVFAATKTANHLLNQLIRTTS